MVMNLPSDLIDIIMEKVHRLRLNDVLQELVLKHMFSFDLVKMLDDIEQNVLKRSLSDRSHPLFVKALRTLYYNDLCVYITEHVDTCCVTIMFDEDHCFIYQCVYESDTRVLCELIKEKKEKKEEWVILRHACHQSLAAFNTMQDSIQYQVEDSIQESMQDPGIHIQDTLAWIQTNECLKEPISNNVHPEAHPFDMAQIKKINCFCRGFL